MRKIIPAILLLATVNALANVPEQQLVEGLQFSFANPIKLARTQFDTRQSVLITSIDGFDFRQNLLRSGFREDPRNPNDYPAAYKDKVLGYFPGYNIGLDEEQSNHWGCLLVTQPNDIAKQEVNIAAGKKSRKWSIKLDKATTTNVRSFSLSSIIAEKNVRTTVFSLFNGQKEYYKLICRNSCESDLLNSAETSDAAACAADSKTLAPRTADILQKLGIPLKSESAE